MELFLVRLLFPIYISIKKLKIIKNYLIRSFVIILTGISGQEKINSKKENIDIEKERTAILEVIHKEGEVFANYDMESLSALHVQDKSDTRLAGTQVYKGWSDIKKLLESYIEVNKQDTVSTNVRNEKENIILKVTGNTAWLICDNIWKWETNGQLQSAKNIQISFLEKINDEWKFSFNAFVAGPDQEQVSQ